MLYESFWADADDDDKFIYKIPRFSYVEPKDYSKKIFACHDLFNSVALFLMRNFDGAIKLKFPQSFYGDVDISPRGFAYFIRVLLAEVYGNYLVQAEFTASDEEIAFSLEVPKNLKCLSELKAIAEKSGFSFESEDGKITIRTKCVENYVLYVYAHDNLKFINYLMEVFLTQK